MSRARGEYLPAGPMSAWVTREIVRADRREDVEGGGGLGNNRGGGMKYVSRRLGVDPRLVGLWRDQINSEGKPVDSFPRATIEDALDRYGVFLWDVYEDLDEDVGIHDRFCARCAEDVTVGNDGRCPWCETPTERPRIAPDRQTARRERTGRKLSTVKRPRPGSKSMPIAPKPSLDPVGDVDEAMPVDAWPLPRSHGRGVPPRITRAQMAEAAWLYYYDGLGFVRIARRLRLPYSSERSGGHVLWQAFQKLNWPSRDRVQATMLASYKHGLKARDNDNPAYRRWYRTVSGQRQPRCAARKIQPPEAGRRCKSAAMQGSRYCYGHDPATANEAASNLAMGRAMRDADMVPIDPFVWWLWGLHDRHGTWKAVAKALDADRSMLERWVSRRDNTGVAGSKTTVSRALVRRKLAIAGDGLTFEQLYEVVEDELGDAKDLAA